MASKTINGEGSIVQLEKDKAKGKCRRWQLRVSTGRDPKTGKYLRKTRVVKGTYSEAQRELRSFIKEVEEDTLSGRKSGGSYVNQIQDCITLVFQRAVKEGDTSASLAGAASARFTG